MQPWMWILLGMALMGIEMFAVDAAYYLIFIGVAALLVGILGFVGLTLPVWGQLAIFAVLALVFMVFFREKLYNKFRGGLAGFRDSGIDSLVEVSEEVPPNGETRVKLRGSQWTATNIDSQAIRPGAKAKVVEIDGVRLKITAVDCD